MRAFGVGFNFVGVRALGVAVLQRGEAVAVARYVGVDGVGIERLTHHEHRFAVGVALVADEVDVRC